METIEVVRYYWQDNYSSLLLFLQEISQYLEE